MKTRKWILISITCACLLVLAIFLILMNRDVQQDNEDREAGGDHSYLTMDDSARDATLRVVIIDTANMLRLETDSFHNIGFDIELERFTLRDGFVGGFNDMFEEVSRFIAENLDSNTVFLGYPGWSLNPMPIPRTEMRDFYETGNRNALNFMIDASEHIGLNPPGTMYLIPTSFHHMPRNIPVVLVRNDILEEWDGEIRTSFDYIELLEWLAMQNPSQIPGITYSNIHSTRSDLSLAFHLPRYGYMYLNNGLMINLQTRDIRFAYNSMEFIWAMEDHSRLSYDGLLYIARPFGRPYAVPRWNDFPTALVHLDYLEIHARAPFYQIPEGLMSFDARDYQAFVLYNNELPHVNLGFNIFRCPEFITVAPPIVFGGPGADISELMRFLEWMGELENYRLFFFGDNEDISGRLNLYWAFGRSRLNELSFNAPFNMANERASFRYSFEIRLCHESVRDLLTWHEFHFNFIIEMEAAVRRLNLELFRNRPSFEVHIQRAIIDFNDRIYNLGVFPDMYEEIINRLVQEAKQQ